jgi:hypothetical protein
MRALRPILTVIGALALAVGLLFFAQGMGWLLWPASSPMLASREWVIRGAALAVVGLLLLIRGRMRRY